MPLLTCDPRDNVPSGYLINPACFSLPADGTNGNFILPYMKAQAYKNVDLSLFKNFNLGGDKKLQLRFNAYNVFNHPIAYPGPGHQPDAALHERRHVRPQLRQAPRGQQVRPPHRPARREVYFLKSTGAAPVQRAAPVFCRCFRFPFLRFRSSFLRFRSPFPARFQSSLSRFAELVFRRPSLPSFPPFAFARGARLIMGRGSFLWRP